MGTSVPPAEIVVVGRACRLPGANSVDELWANLVAGRCAISRVPADRWSLDKHWHPRAKEPGKSYTWAAGVLDDLWGFDPAAFGISPREAEQMDPQQRLLLELTWEALEDAGIRRASIAGTDVGVFVGASGFDFSVVRSTDMAGGDAYTATGGALSIISNRISHAFDLKGPSYTVDTACSSSLVALDQAMQALRSGRVDTAIVAGVNALTSPFGFITFSQASMLSPTGLCRTFDAEADGYVRAEGAVVLVLKTLARAREDQSRAHAALVASGVNSDGRTNGIALPSRFAQADLLRRVYGEAGIVPDDMAFVEAHGTGTRVGDPIEANTIGEVLGQGRGRPLLVGSIKSNIGHLEPASGLAGLLKAMLALEHDLLPPSVNFSAPNPDIPFEDLNLAVCASATALPRDGEGRRYAGINSFGFGGTNAHAILADPPRARVGTKRQGTGTQRFALSAASRPGLRDMARLYAEQLEHANSDDVADIAAAAIHRRDPMTERVVVDWRSPRDLVRKLERVSDKDDDTPGITWGSAVEPHAPVAFVFSGNGGQWPGMGQAAYTANARFREAFDEVDSLFDSQFGWSVCEALFANDLDQRIGLTHIAQPLIFSIQIATARALAAEGLAPSFTLGHSVGEVAAAQIAGALTLADAVRVIQARSTHQELAHDTGRMAVVVGARERIEDLAAEIGEVTIAAYNSPRTFTLAGPTDRIKALGALARRKRIVFRQLDLDYPFHCGLIDVVRAPLLRDLSGLTSTRPTLPFISTVTGAQVDEASLDANYWWRNVREPVRFEAAIGCAADLGARVFVEIGPRSVLLGNIGEIMEPSARAFAAMGVLEKTETSDDRDPIRAAVTAAFARGAAIDLDRVFGAEPSGPVALPTYPWQRRDFRMGVTSEAVGSTLATGWHRLIGARHSADAVEWIGLLDTASLPELADHRVGGQAILPGAAFIEIALTVARDWYGTDTACLLELDIAQALPLEHDRSREVMARLSPQTGSLEIMTRPRLTRGGWQIHAVAKLSRGDEPAAQIEATGQELSGARLDAARPDVAPDGAGASKPVSAEAVYAAAREVGLDYGPAFRLLRSVTRMDSATLAVELAPSACPGAYRIDPARLDACFHGLFVLFGDLGAARNGTAFIPVRFGPTRVLIAGANPVRALIHIRRANARAIVADFTLFDAAGDAVAVLSEARFQAARVQRASAFAQHALVLDTILGDGSLSGRTGSPATTDTILAAAASLGLAASDDSPSDEQLLLEGWSSAIAYEIARGAAAADGTITPDLIAGLQPHVASWLVAILHQLEAAGLVSVRGTGWFVEPESDLPPSHTVLRALADESPHRSAELLLAASLGAIDAASVWDGAFDPAPAAGLVAGFELEGASVRGCSQIVEHLMRKAALARSAGRAIRILQIGFGPLSHALAALADETDAALTILEVDPRRLELARLALGTGRVIALAGSADALTHAGYDLIVAADALHRLSPALSMADLRDAGAPGAVLLAVEPLPSGFRDLVLGLQPRWFGGAGAQDFPVGALRTKREWVRLIEGVGFSKPSASIVRTGHEIALLLIAGVPEGVVAAEVSARTMRVEGGDGSGLAGEITAALATRGQIIASANSDAAPEAVLFVAAAGGDTSDVDALQAICMGLKACAERHSGEKPDLWVVLGSRHVGDPLCDPVVAGAAAFSRTLANEYAGLRVRRLAVSAGPATEDAAEAIATILLSGTPETDICVTPDGPRLLRVQAAGPARYGAARAPAARLDRGMGGGLANLDWTAADVTSPLPDEVRIAVEATGLNFRDVMWALSLLPDDVLEDGFAGPSLGLECAGRVLEVGADVGHVRRGDRVVTFAPAAFATSVTVPGGVVARIPDALSTEAAATLPVAFLTAYYSLVTLGGLTAGQSVLIHGGAGGVGLAAIQIAQWVGADIVATAGTAAKRDLLRTLGVPHVLNSRSSAFADNIRVSHPDGVDLVLNSLSGEAMERGLAVLKPFGRFVELGKRDYVANTHVGLRPFRRNLSYFGVDVDQLLSDRNRASGVFAEVMARVAEGAFRPLPYRVFPAAETVDAFRLMQRSGHVGKILIAPPDKPVTAAGVPVVFSPAGTHLLTGGFGGFGLEAARWLADRGARHLVLVGRSGAASEEAVALVAELQARGVSVRAEACDVADARALGALLSDVRATMPPLCGIMHAAMVLEDSVIANLSGDQLARVLGPKVEGARLLVELTAGDALDYFVLFSSVTTLVGNPGQGAYVAANGYLEGLARRRRLAGRAALAVAWGAIADVGVLARDAGLAEILAKRTGVRAMPAREALDIMAQAMERPATAVEEAVIAIGTLDWTAARRLPLLASPTFASLLREGSEADKAERVSIDLKALVATKDPEAVRLQVSDVILEEIAAVLRIPKQDVVKTKRLAELGLDSLMAIELVTGLQDRFDLVTPPSGSVGTLTVMGLADHLVASVQGGGGDEDMRVAQALNERHGGADIDVAALTPLTEAVGEHGRQMRGLLQ